MRIAKRSISRRGRPRRAAAMIEMAIIMPVFLLLILGCLNFGRFANVLIAVTNAARAGAGVGVMSRDPDLPGGTGLASWQKRICTAVADELGMSDDFTPAGSIDPNGYSNSQGLYVQAVRIREPDGPWRAQVTARYPFDWWGLPGDVQPQQTVVLGAIR